MRRLGLVRCSDGQKEYSKLVAHNLYNFMMSYHNAEMVVSNANGREFLVLPSEVFTRWMKKFDEKWARTRTSSSRPPRNDQKVFIFGIS